MIVHIVLCKPREDLSATEIEELAQVLEGFRNVPGVRDFSSGADFSGRGKGYSRAAVMRFANRDTLHSKTLRLACRICRLHDGPIGRSGDGKQFEYEYVRTG